MKPLHTYLVIFVVACGASVGVHLVLPAFVADTARCQDRAVLETVAGLEQSAAFLAGMVTGTVQEQCHLRADFRHANMQKCVAAANQESPKTCEELQELLTKTELPVMAPRFQAMPKKGL